jgi:biopolymer transport protein TolR
MGMDTGGSGGVKNDINVTPLVDVCLVLLIIFMVVTPMLQEGVPVQLPNARNPEPQPDKDQAIQLAISNDGKCFINDKWAPPEVMRTQLQEEFARNENKAIYLKGDRRINFGQVKDLMKVVQDIGFKHVGLVAQHVDEQGNAVTGNAANAMAGVGK